MESKVVGSMSEWSGMLMDLHRQIHDGGIQKHHLRALLERRNPFEQKAGVANIDLAKAYELCGMKAEYEAAAKSFDLTEDPSVWKLLMVKGLTFAKLAEGYRKAKVKLETFGVDLEKAIAKDKERCDPNRDGTYLTVFARNVEADEQNANQSANERAEAKCTDITLMAQLLLELAYFLATGEHLDVINVTQCAGSRSLSGNVPRVLWIPDDCGVYVYWSRPGCADGRLRARSEVSSS